ncbi:MAG: tryptophan 2,3-dioxygenase [Kiritimatiellia bacterium]|jgi:tryptophan 2,3-dioxygenase
MKNHTPTYWDYLNINTLLSLQDGLDGGKPLHADETHFIVVHQIHELWFKLCIGEVRLARDKFESHVVAENTIPFVVHHMRRVIEILNVSQQHWSVVETLTPLDFLDFRDKLTPASGFQSYQIRVLEILLGLDESMRETEGTVNPFDHIRKLTENSPGGAVAWEHIEKARSERTLRACIHDWLYRTPIQGSSPGDPGDDEVVKEFIESYLQSGRDRNTQRLERLIEVSAGEPAKLKARFTATETSTSEFLTTDDPRLRRIRAAVLFIESYRELPLLAWPRLLIDTVMELEQQFVMFRARHARMVERMIGRRVGTGGSSGVDYLDKTTQYRVFPELWAVRTCLQPRDALPELKNREAYDFVR